MDERTIRTAVRERYGAIAEAAAGPAVTEGGACCGPSCCEPAADAGSTVTRVVDEGLEAGSGATVATTAAGATVAATEIGYSPEELASLPDGAELGLGCGNPTALAGLRPGETVLDLGSGGGVDCFLASERVGPEGSVIGVDMTPEMVERARANATSGGYGNVEFRLGEIEALPVADGTVDVIISNCVLNLSARREAAFREAFRVLRPGGRVLISDMLSTEPAPAALQESVDLLVGCLPIHQGEYLEQLAAAGFEDVRVEDARPYPPGVVLDDARLIELVGDDRELQAEVERFAGSARGAQVAAVKPDA